MKRERSSGAYRMSSFIVAKVLVDVPSNVLRILPFFVILYWMVGLRANAAAYFLFIAINSMQVVMAVCEYLHPERARQCSQVALSCN